jgi:hypothetical protein
MKPSYQIVDVKDSKEYPYVTRFKEATAIAVSGIIELCPPAMIAITKLLQRTNHLATDDLRLACSDPPNV